jgi:heptosyltransferase-2
VAFEVPCIVLMGPTSLEKTNLNLEGVRVFESDVECRPCYERSCPIDHRCMTRLEPEPVARVARELLSRRPGAGR